MLILLGTSFSGFFCAPPGVKSENRTHFGEASSCIAVTQESKDN